MRFEPLKWQDDGENDVATHRQMPNTLQFAALEKGTMMAIYGTGLLAICLVVGLIIGRIFGMMLGLEKANLGGVGIAMLLLIFCCDRLQRAGRMPKPTQQGILFWSSIYIPIVVAMAASQNVVKAISGGAMAVVAGTLVVAISFALVPLISRIGADGATTTDQDDAA